MTGPAVNPFDDIDATPSNPFDDIGAEPDYSTAAGRQVANMNELAAYTAQLRAIKPANPAHKARIDQELKAAEAELSGQAPDRSWIENLVRGGSAGALRGTMAGAEVASGLLPDFVPGVKPLESRIHEAQAGIQEEFDPRGKVAAGAQFGGELMTSLPAYGGFASGTARAIVASAPKSIAARLVQAAATGGTAETVLGRMLQRSGANVLAGVPINVGLALSGEGTPEDKTKQIALGAAADALFGILPHLGNKKAPKEAAPEAPVGATAERRAAEADKLTEQAKARAAVKEVETKLNRRAQVEWEYRNPDAVWKDLPAKEKKRVREEFKSRVATEAEQAASQPVPATEPPVAPTPTDSKLNTSAANAGELDRRAKPRPDIENLSPAVKNIRAKQLEDQIMSVNHILGSTQHTTPEDIVKYTEMKNRLQGEVDQLRGKPPETAPAYDLEGTDISYHNPEDQTNLHTLPHGKPGIEFQNGEDGMFIVARDKNGVPEGYLGLMKLETPGEYGAMDVYVRSDRRRAGLATNLYKIASNAGARHITTGYGGYTTDAGEALGKSLVDKGIVAHQIPRGEAAPFAGMGEAAVQPSAAEPAPSPATSSASDTGSLPASPAVSPPSPTSVSDQELRALHSVLSVPSKRPLFEMTDTEFERVENKVLEKLEATEKTDPDAYAQAQEDLQRIMDEQKRRNSGGKIGELPLPEGVVVRPEMAPGVTGAAVESGAPRRLDKLADQPVRAITGDQARKFFKTPIGKLSDADLSAHIQDLDDRVTGMTGADAKDAGYTQRLSAAMEEKARRSNAGPGPLSAQMPPGVGGGALGFTLGLTAPAKDEEDRWGNAWMGLAIGAGVGVLGPKALQRFSQSKAKYDFLPGEEAVAKVVASVADVEPQKTSFLERMRNLYWGIARRSYGLDRAAASLGIERSPTSKNFAKLGAIFGRWVSMSESAMQDGPRLIDGETKLDSPSIADIFKVAGGTDEAIDKLGHLMTARTSLELAGSQTVPVDPVSADLLYRNAPENLHQAADMSRKFSLAMAQVLVDAQVLAQNTIAKFQQEEFYAPLHRLFAVERPPKLLVEQSGKVVVVSPNPVKGRKGGSQLIVQNPVEAMVGMVPRIYRAAELNRIKIRALEAWEAAGKPNEVFKRIRKAEVQNTPEFDNMVKYLRQEVKRLDQGEAESLVAALHEKSLDPTASTMTVYRNGALESYRVNKEVAESLNAMNPADIQGLFKLLGAPAQLARLGIVNNPYFVAKMAFIDNWQAFMNSQYGFRFGADQVAGWYNIVRRSPEYKNYVAGGGGHSSLSSYQYTNVRTAIPAIRSGSEGALSAAWKDMKEFRVLDAWRQLIIPVAEAARVGEFLAARRHGADVLEAVYAAKHVTGNFGQRGGYTEMQALNHMALFTNPAIQALDQAVYRSGLHPFRTPEEGRLSAAVTYLTKGLVSISLPSYLLWHRYKDDQEINDLRMTDTGRKYWFMRSSVDIKPLGIKQGDIVRIPKPIFEGQLFGTSTEATLDKQNNQDPEAMRNAMAAVWRDASFNLAPTVGVTAYNLATGTGPFGGSLVPAWEQGLSLEHQGEEKASWMARMISKKAAPSMENVQARFIRNSVTPAGIDYLVQSVTGMLGQDAMQAVTIAMDREEKGYSPTKAEMPVIGRLFADYPSLNVQPIREFYNRSARIDEVNKTIDHWALEDPNKLVKYMMSHQEEMQLIGLNASIRQKMSNFSRAIHDTRSMPKDYLSYEDRKAIIKQYMTVMIDEARVANGVARQLVQK